MSTDYDYGVEAVESYEERAAREEREERERLIAGLRELADLLEQHPAMPAPYVHVAAYVDNAAAGRRARRGIPGWTKRVSRDSAYDTYTKPLGGGDEYSGLALQLEVSKSETCRRVQVGTRHVEAVEAHDVPVYEWDCGGES